MPERIQRKRTKGWKMPSGAIYVGRPSKWGNPYPAGEELESIQAVECYREALPYRADLDVSELRDKNLACWCPIISHGIYRPCHADVLISIANDTPMEEVIRENIRRAESGSVEM